MKNVSKRLLALMLSLCMILGMASMVQLPKAAAAAVEPGEVMGYISTGDSTFVAAEIPMYTKESMDALLDMYEDFGMKRIYWRGLQNELWNQTQEYLQESPRSVYHYAGILEQFLEFEAEYGMTMDEYFVSEAHKRGIEVYGVSSLSDWGSGWDIPINGWPCSHNAFVRLENPEWVPKDKYGLVEQGGAIEFSYAEAREWYVNLHANEIKAVGYDGVLFITYSENYSINYNNQFGYSEPAKEAFYEQYGVDASTGLSRWASMTDWQRLRGDYLTQLFRELNAAVGQDVDVCLFLDPRDPWHMQVWNAAEMLTNGIYLDLWTYVSEGLIDQFVVNGASSVDAQMTTVENMLQLCEGTGTSVAINTSNAGAPQWDALLEKGVDIITYGSGEYMLYDRAEAVGDPETDEDLALRLWLASLGAGKSKLNQAGSAQVTIDDLSPYILEQDENGVQGYKYNVTIRRLALTAIKTLYLAGGADVAEQAVVNDPDTGVRAMAADTLRYVNDNDSYLALIEAINLYDEFAINEAATVALYVNTKWASGVATEYDKYVNDNSEDGLRTQANLLRAMAYMAPAANQARFEAALTKYGPNNTLDVQVGYDPAELQLRLEEGTALAKVDVVLEEMWYDAIRYYAAQGIGNMGTTASIEKMIELAVSEDTMVSTPAIAALSKRASTSVLSAASAPELRAKAIETLDTIYGMMGEGSTHSTRDYAYRPVGEALLMFGEEGEAVLRKYYNGSDPVLALYAWRNLYIPATCGAYNEMTEAEYDDAYKMLPVSLKEFSNVRMSQGFESTGTFYAGLNGYTGDAGTLGGRWGSLNPGGVEVSSFAKSGKQSLRMERGGGTGHGITATTSSKMIDGETYQMSFWLYRTNGANLTFGTRNSSGGYEIQANLAEGGKLVFWDYDTGKWGTDAILTVPENQWVQLTTTVNRSDSQLTVTLTTDDGVVTEGSAAVDIQTIDGVDRLYVNMGTVAGGVAYFDDFSMVCAKPTTVERSEGASIHMEDVVFAYDGTAKTVEATTNLMDSPEITYTYKNFSGEELESFPVNAGSYLVTASTTYEGVDYSDTGVLKIVPVAVTVAVSGGVTASDIAYGDELNDSELTIAEGTFIGLEPVSDEVVLQEVKTTILDQSFDDSSFEFNASNYAGDAATTAGRWWIATGTLSADIGGNTTNAAKGYRCIDDSVNQALAVTFTNGVSVGTDFVYSMLVYREENANFNMSLDNNKSVSSGELITAAQLMVNKDGGVGIGSGYSTDAGVTVPAGTWVELSIHVDAEAQTYSISTTVDGVTTQGTATAAWTEAAINRVQFNPSNGVTTANTFYLDDVSIVTTTWEEVVPEAPVLSGTIAWNEGKQLPVDSGYFTYTFTPDDTNYKPYSAALKVVVAEPEKEPTYETQTKVVLDQDFNDSTFLSTTNETNSVGTSGTEAGKWYTTGSYNITANTDKYYGTSGQSVAIYRGGAAHLYGPLAAALSQNADFEMSMKIYRPDTMSFTFTMGEVSFFAVNNNQLKISNNSSGYTDYVNFSWPADTWVDVNITSDRASGNYTITLTKEDGTVVGSATSALYAFTGTPIITFGAQASSDSTLTTPYAVAYIDDIKLITTQTVEVDEIEYIYTDKLYQDFENLTFTANSTSMAAGEQAGTGGRWFRYASSEADTTLITQVSESNKALELYRDDTSNKYANVAVADGVAAETAYSVSYDFYVTAQGDVTLTMNNQYYFRIVAGGNLRLFNNGTFSSNVEMVVPTEEWVNLCVDVAADGSFTVTMTEADGTVTVSPNKGSVSTTSTVKQLQFNNNSKVGISAYLDNVKLTQVEEAPDMYYEVVGAQDFEDLTFSASGANMVADDQTNNGGKWTIENATADDQFIYQLTDTTNTTNAVQLYRTAAGTLEDGTAVTAVMKAVVGALPGVTADTGYQIVFDVYLESTRSFTLSTNTGYLFMVKSGGALVYYDAANAKWDGTTQLMVPENTWVTMTVTVDSTGTYTVSVTNGTSVTEAAGTGTISVSSALNNIKLTANAPYDTNGSIAYFDNVAISKEIPSYTILDVAVSGTNVRYDGTPKHVNVSVEQDVDYTVWYDGSTTAPTEPGTYTVQVLVTKEHYRGSALTTMTITNGKPAQSGSLEYIEVANGTTLGDIDLSVISFNVDGQLSWNDDTTAALTAAGSYGWTFEPTDSNYDSVSGSVYVNVQNAENAVAAIGDTTYASVAMAVAQADAGETITMIANTAEAGVAINKSVTIDFAGHSYTVTSGTVTFAEGNVIELKSGTISGGVSMLLQNAADLTLTDMVLSTSGTALYNGTDRSLTVVYTDDYVGEGAAITGAISINGDANVAFSGGTYTAKISDSWCAEGYQAVQLSDGTWTVMDKDLCNAAKIGSVYYADIQSALDAAVSGDIITLLTSGEQDAVYVSAGVTLDLNGYTLTGTNYVICFGQIIDSGDGTGAVIADANSMILSSDNAQLPLYDSALGGYRFFSYSFKTLGAYTDTASGSGVYGLRLLLENEDGYALLGSADSGMTVKVTLTWPDMTSQAPSFTFSSDVMALYTGKIADVPAYALLVKVTGAEGLAVTMTPVIETVSRMGAEADPVTHTAQAAE